MSMLERTVEVVDELRQVLTEGHQLLSDLRRERKEIEEAIARARSVAHDSASGLVEERAGKIVSEELAKIGPDIARQRDALLDRFDEAMTAYMNLARFGNKQGRGEDVMKTLALRTHAARRKLLELGGRDGG